MKTGFYDIKTLSEEQLTQFYKETLMLSYFVITESKYTAKNDWRGIDDKYTIQDFLNMVSVDNHNVCIDRSIQYGQIKDNNIGEIGFILDSKFDKEWHQITFNVTLENLKKLTDKFKLEMG